MADAFSEEALPRRAFELAWVDSSRIRIHVSVPR